MISLSHSLFLIFLFVLLRCNLIYPDVLTSSGPLSDAYRDTPQFQFRESVKEGKRKLKKLGFRIYMEGMQKRLESQRG